MERIEKNPYEEIRSVLHLVVHKMSLQSLKKMTRTGTATDFGHKQERKPSDEGLCKTGFLFAKYYERTKLLVLLSNMYPYVSGDSKPVERHSKR